MTTRSSSESGSPLSLESLPLVVEMSSMSGESVYALSGNGATVVPVSRELPPLPLGDSAAKFSRTRGCYVKEKSMK